MSTTTTGRLTREKRKSCHHCHRIAELQPIPVALLTDDQVTQTLLLCSRCVRVEEATWRLRWQPISEDEATDQEAPKQ